MQPHVAILLRPCHSLRVPIHLLQASTIASASLICGPGPSKHQVRTAGSNNFEVRGFGKPRDTPSKWQRAQLSLRRQYYSECSAYSISSQFNPGAHRVC